MSYLRLGQRPSQVVLTRTGDLDRDLKDALKALSFELGFGSKEHLLDVADQANLILIAGKTSAKRLYAAKYVEQTVLPVLQELAEDVNRPPTKWQVTVMRRFPVFKRAFWSANPSDLYLRAVEELKASTSDKQQ